MELQRSCLALCPTLPRQIDAANNTLYTKGVIALEHDFFEGGVVLFNQTFYPEIVAAGYKFMPLTQCLGIPSFKQENIIPPTPTAVVPPPTNVTNTTGNGNNTGKGAGAGHIDGGNAVSVSIAVFVIVAFATLAALENSV